MKTRNKRLALMLAIPLFAGTFVAGMGMLETVEASAEEGRTVSITMGSIPNAIKDTDDHYAENDLFRYTAKATENLFNASAENYGMTSFDTYENNKLTLSTKSGLIIQNWKWEFVANTSVVFEFTAKADGALAFDFTVANLESANAFADGWNTVFSVHRLNAEDSTLDTLVNYFHSADSAGGPAISGDIWEWYKENLTKSFEMKEGDTLYYEFGSIGARSIANVNAAKATFTEIVTPDEPEPEPEPEPEIKEMSGSVATVGDLPNNINSANFGYLRYEGFDITAKASTALFKADAPNYGLVPFDTYDSANKILTNSAIGTLAMQNWRWTFAANTSIVLELKATKDGTLAFDFTMLEKFGGYWDGWNTIFTVRRMNVDGSVDIIHNYFQNNDKAGNGVALNSGEDIMSLMTKVMSLEIDVKEGDVVYYEIGSTAGRNLQSVTVGTVSYTAKAEEPDPQPEEPEIKEMEGAVATFGDIPAAIKDSKYGTLRYEGFDLRAMAAPALLKGDVEGYGLVSFDTYDETDSYKLLTNSGIAGLYMYNWKWEVAANTSIVLEATATKDGTIVFDFTMLEKFGGFWDGWNTIFTVRRVNAADDTVDVLRNYFQNVDKTGNGVALNTTTDTYTIYHLMTKVMSLEIEVKEGDVIYYEIGATAGRNLQSDTVGTVSYTEKTVEPEPEPDPEPQPEPGEIIEYETFGAVPSNVYKAGYGYVEGVNVRYTAMAGLFDASAENYGLVPFDKYEESTDNKTLTAESKSGLLFQNWRWYFGANTSGVLVIESKIKGTISFDYPSTQDGWNDAYNTIYTVHVLRADGTLVTLVDYFHGTDSVSGNQYTTSNMADLRAALSIKIDVEVGDVIYYEVGSIQNGRNFQCREAAQFIAAPADEVLEARAEYAAKLQALYESLTATDYSEVNWAAITAAYNAFATEGAACESVEEVAALYEAKVAAIMATVKAEFKAKGEALVATLSEADYTAENWATIQTLSTEYFANVEGAESVDAIKALYTAFRNAVYAVPATDFVAIKKAELRAQLQAVIEALDETTFSEGNWLAVEHAFEVFEDGLADCTTEEAVQALYDAQYAVIVGTVATQRKADLKAYYDGLDSANYSAEKFASITELYNAFAGEVAACTTIEEVEQLYADFLESMKSYKAEKQSFIFLDYPTIMNANGYNWIEGDVFGTKLYAGNVKTDNLVEFDTQGSADSEMYASSITPNVRAQTWKWYITRDIGIIAAFKANADLKLTITDTRVTEASDKTNGWTANTTLNVYIVRSGVAKLIKTVDSPASDADFCGEYYLQAGDMLYWEYISYSITDGSERNLEAPYRTSVFADSTAFDEEAYVNQNHDLAKEVTDKIEELLQALRDYYASLNEDDYSATNWLTLEQYVEQFEEACAGFDIETVEDVQRLYDEALAGMKSVMTKAQAEEDLRNTLQGYADELQAEYDKLLAENEYTEENKALLDKALADGKAAVLAATNKSAGNTERLKALAALRAVEKGTQSGGNQGGGENTGNTKKGCFGTVSAAGGIVTVVIAAAAVAVAILIRKKKEN